MKLFKLTLKMFVFLIFYSYLVSATGISFGLKYGLNLATWQSEINNKRMQFKKGFVISGMLDIKFVKYFSVQSEVLFSMKGYKEEGIPNRDGSGRDYSINYLEIPLLLKLNIPVRKFIPNFYIGPDLGVCLSSECYWPVPGDLKKKTNDIDFSLCTGLGVKYLVWIGGVIFDYRYTFGINQAFKNIGYKNCVFSFMIGYEINL
ncbi:MAG: PorT family protein [archaeon]|nr:PorT family protein [archaeon]